MSSRPSLLMSTNAAVSLAPESIMRIEKGTSGGRLCAPTSASVPAARTTVAAGMRFMRALLSCPQALLRILRRLRIQNQAHEAIAPLVDLLVWHTCDVLEVVERLDRKSTRLNSSHGSSSYAVFCLKKKKQHC